MLKRSIGIFLVMLPFGQTAMAVTCSNYPYTFSNGTTADASQVNADFTSILNCANTYLAPLASPSFTGNVSFAGNVGIGTASPATRLVVQQSSDPAIGSDGTSNSRVYNTAGTSFLQMQVNSTGAELSSSGTSTFLPLFLNVSRATVPPFTILANGNVGINTTSPTQAFFVNGNAGGTSTWVQSSDARLKKDITTISDALNLVKRLRGVRFNWRSAKEREVGDGLKLPADEKQIGFIAQEVEAVVPEAVVAPKKGSNGLYGLKEADLIPILVEAVKQQQTEIEQLRASLAALETKKNAGQ